MSNFWNCGQWPNFMLFFKIVIFGHELGHWQKTQKLHIYFLSTPPPPEIELIFALRAAVSKIRTNFQNLQHLGMKLSYWQKFQKLHTHSLSSTVAIWGHKTWSLVHVPEISHIPFFYPKGSKLGLFLLYRQQFPSYGPIFKICHIWAFWKSDHISETAVCRAKLSWISTPPL